MTQKPLPKRISIPAALYHYLDVNKNEIEVRIMGKKKYVSSIYESSSYAITKVFKEDKKIIIDCLFSMSSCRGWLQDILFCDLNGLTPKLYKNNGMIPYDIVDISSQNFLAILCDLPNRFSIEKTMKELNTLEIRYRLPKSYCFKIPKTQKVYLLILPKEFNYSIPFISLYLLPFKYGKELSNLAYYTGGKDFIEKMFSRWKEMTKPSRAAYSHMKGVPAGHNAELSHNCGITDFSQHVKYYQNRIETKQETLKEIETILKSATAPHKARCLQHEIITMLKEDKKRKKEKKYESKKSAGNTEKA